MAPLRDVEYVTPSEGIEVNGIVGPQQTHTFNTTAKDSPCIVLGILHSVTSRIVGPRSMELIKSVDGPAR